MWNFQVLLIFALCTSPHLSFSISVNGRILNRLKGWTRQTPADAHRRTRTIHSFIRFGRRWRTIIADATMKSSYKIINDNWNRFSRFSCWHFFWNSFICLCTTLTLFSFAHFSLSSSFTRTHAYILPRSLSLAHSANSKLQHNKHNKANGTQFIAASVQFSTSDKERRNEKSLSHFHCEFYFQFSFWIQRLFAFWMRLLLLSPLFWHWKGIFIALKIHFCL